MWRSLTRPPFNVIPHEVIVFLKPVLPLIGIAICVLETGYPLFIWLKRTRLMWLAGILTMHIAIGLAMGLYLFALVMIVLNLAAFAPKILFEKDAPKHLLPVNDGHVRNRYAGAHSRIIAPINNPLHLCRDSFEFRLNLSRSR